MIRIQRWSIVCKRSCCDIRSICSNTFGICRYYSKPSHRPQRGNRAFTSRSSRDREDSPPTHRSYHKTTVLAKVARTTEDEVQVEVRKRQPQIIANCHELSTTPQATLCKLWVIDRQDLLCLTLPPPSPRAPASAPPESPATAGVVRHVQLHAAPYLSTPVVQAIDFVLLLSLRGSVVDQPQMMT